MSEETKETPDQGSAFGEAEAPKPEENKQGVFSNDALPDEIKDLVGENKKYKSVTDALRSVPHAQTHIQKLEEELAELRSKVQEQKTIDDLLQRIEQKENTTTQQTTESRGLSPEEIQQLVEQTLTVKQQKEIFTKNVSTVDQKIRETYGEKAQEFVLNKSKELGISVSEMQGIAAKSPNAFYNLVGFNEKNKETPLNLRSNVNTEQFHSPQNKSNKTVMFGATTRDMVDAWRAARPTE